MATTAQKSALVALIMASVGGAAFLLRHPNPTQRDVYAACEKGDLNGIVCCEDVSHLPDFAKFANGEKMTTAELIACSAITPSAHDPLGVRDKQEKEWDAAHD